LREAETFLEAWRSSARAPSKKEFKEVSNSTGREGEKSVSEAFYVLRGSLEHEELLRIKLGLKNQNRKNILFLLRMATGSHPGICCFDEERGGGA